MVERILFIEDNMKKNICERSGKKSILWFIYVVEKQCIESVNNKWDKKINQTNISIKLSLNKKKIWAENFRFF